MSSRQFYDAYASGYESYVRRHAGYLFAVEKAIIEVSNGRSDIALLDVGTGTGERLQRLVLELLPNRVTAIDNSREMVALARRNCPVADVRTLALGDPELSSAIPGGFDLVTCLSNVLGHVPRDLLVPGLRQIRSLLKPGGTFVLDVNNRYNAASYGGGRVARNIIRDCVLPRGRSFTAAYQAGDEVLRTQVHLFRPAEVIALLRKSGFASVRVGFRDYATGEECGRFAGSIVAKAVRI
ncbi:bifunctional 2-polyprenyl-6-hydroxyphenol methylase/3-demethylubiquinol 3-O-methyltransferase UbiG [Pseudonocardia sp. ICBG162]|uniref:class I SAM-dependent methyltransferase n=1 Tax=Pseudonocardia sp. ICBG162 TaxID=2846761 RepID=UPI001CF6227D|nr:class I SAM-dependent methyltransferase [Pseudonocardia sp. ICBG162]